MEHKSISSTGNPNVKRWLQLHKRNVREKGDEFMVEGLLECGRGIKSGFAIAELMVCPDLLADDKMSSFINKAPDDCRVYKLSAKVYAKLAYRKDTEGILAIFKKRKRKLDELPLRRNGNSYFIILENIEKPGNLGAVLRTADAVHADGIIITGNSTDHYNPNVIRASLGTVFSVPVSYATGPEILEWSKSNNIRIYGAALPAYNELYALKFDHATAFIFGNEHTGLSEFWLKNTTQNVTIPMKGIADSLNLSVSVAVVSYEFLRQQLT